MKGFLGSGVLEAALGASFVYLLLASFCSTVNEWISTLLNARADTLEKTIRELLSHQNLAAGKEFIAAFYGHPIISAMMPGREHPAWIPARSFTTAVLDLATSNISGSITFEVLETSITTLPTGCVKTALLALIQNAAGDLSRAEANIDRWFNDSMIQASATYKKRARLWTVIIAATLTIAVNADTLRMLESHTAPVLGWSNSALMIGKWEWLGRVTGWSLTIGAVSLGAPFWFDLLDRLVPASKNKSNPVKGV